MKDISIVIPVFNEQDNLPVLAQRLRAVLGALGRTYELIFVDDGSTDKSAEVVRSLKGTDPAVRLIRLRRNFGQTAALSAGFDGAQGSIIVTMDADLQNDPADIPLLIQKIDEGYDLVNGWRKERKDSFWRRIPSQFANRLISYVTGIRLHDYGCTLKAYRSEVAKNLHLYSDMHRFIPALASWAGVRLVEIPVRHHPRMSGKSKYGISRSLRVLLDLFTVKFLLSYSTSPIQIFGGVAAIAAGAGFLAFLVAVFLKIFEGRTLTGNPLFYLGCFMETICVQFILIGLLGEMNVRIYHELQKKKTYVVSDEE